MKSLYLQCCFGKQPSFIHRHVINFPAARCIFPSVSRGTSSENLNKHNNINYRTSIAGKSNERSTISEVDYKY